MSSETREWLVALSILVGGAIFLYGLLMLAFAISRWIF